MSITIQDIGIQQGIKLNEEGKPYITRQWIHSFEVGVVVSHFGREAEIVRVDGQKMRIQYSDTLLHTSVYYTHLEIIKYPEKKTPENDFQHYTEEDEQFIISNPHLQNWQLAKVLKRSVDGVSTKRKKLGVKYKKRGD